MRKPRAKGLVATLAFMLLVLMVFAPAALATTQCYTRVQAGSDEVCASTKTNVPSNLDIPLDGGEVYHSAFPNPLGSLYLAGIEQGFSYEAADAGWGVFVNRIDGYGDPVGWTSWWLYAINGYMAPVGATAWETRENDQYLWFLVPATAPANSLALQVNGPTTVQLGATSTFTVVGDDLNKVNSQADAAAFGLDASANAVQTPSEFAPVAGATVYVAGAEATSDAAGQVTVVLQKPGTRSIWSEKEADADWFYVASTRARTITVPFSDVPASNPYYDAINLIAGLGIVEGYTTGGSVINFGPDNDLYRAQFAKMIVIALGIEVEEGMESPFTDVEAGLYPHDYVAAAWQNGVVNGLTTTTFGPYQNISRAQVVTMAVRALQQFAPSALVTPPSSYTCTWGDFSPVHGPNADIAEYNGLLDGLPLSTTAADPWAPMPRGETAQVLANMIELLGAN